MKKRFNPSFFNYQGNEESNEYPSPFNNYNRNDEYEEKDEIEKSIDDIIFIQNTLFSPGNISEYYIMPNPNSRNKNTIISTIERKKLLETLDYYVNFMTKVF